MNHLNHTRETYHLQLPFGLAFDDLYAREGLLKLDAAFLRQLEETSPALYARLQAGRANPTLLAPKQHSELIIELAPYLEDFIGQLFGIEPELRELQHRHSELAPLYSVKRRFVQRKALTGMTVEKTTEIDGFAVGAELETFFEEPLTEMSFARPSSNWNLPLA